MEDADCVRTGEDLEAKPPGLSEALVELFASQLEQQRARQQNPGRKVILFDDSGQRIEEESAIPPHLVEAVMTAHEMNEVNEMGAMPVYPEYYSPAQWACFRALTRARLQDRAIGAEERQTQNHETTERNRLDHLRKRKR